MNRNCKINKLKEKKLNDISFDKSILITCTSFCDALVSQLFAKFAIIHQLFFAFEFCVCFIFSYDQMSALNFCTSLNSKNRTLFIHKYFFLIPMKREKKRLAGWNDDMIFNQIKFNIEIEHFFHYFYVRKHKNLIFLLTESI